MITTLVASSPIATSSFLLLRSIRRLCSRRLKTRWILPLSTLASIWLSSLEEFEDSEQSHERRLDVAVQDKMPRVRFSTNSSLLVSDTLERSTRLNSACYLEEFLPGESSLPHVPLLKLLSIVSLAGLLELSKQSTLVAFQLSSSIEISSPFKISSTTLAFRSPFQRTKLTESTRSSPPTLQSNSTLYKRTW